MTHTAKHTPGPWVVRNMSDAMAEKFTVERLSDNGLRSVICRINDMEVCPEHGGTGSDANAALIAAAPAMYEALQGCLRVAQAHLHDTLARWEDCEGKVPSGIAELDAARMEVVRIQAVLSQAEGQQL